MSFAATQLVGRFFESLKRGEIDAALALTSDDVLVDRRNSNAPWGRHSSRGRHAFREAFEGFQRQWAEIGGVGWERVAMRPVGGGQVAVETRIFGSGPATGLALEARGGWLIETAAEAVSGCTLFQSFDEALAEGRRRAFADARLYFVCDARPHGRDPQPLLEAAMSGGADVVQLRDKLLGDEALIEAALPFRAAADSHGALFVLNDRPDLVAAADADGVHVGQDDDAVAVAREVAGPAAVVGLSTHTVPQVEAAAAAVGDSRPDQISVGPVWETPTKQGRPATGLELITSAAELAAELAWFAIGGIDIGNVGDVAAAGARRIVVVRAIRDASDPRASAAALRAALGPGAEG